MDSGFIHVPLSEPPAVYRLSVGNIVKIDGVDYTIVDHTYTEAGRDYVKVGGTVKIGGRAPDFEFYRQWGPVRTYGDTYPNTLYRMLIVRSDLVTFGWDGYKLRETLEWPGGRAFIDRYWCR